MSDSIGDEVLVPGDFGSHALAFKQQEAPKKGRGDVWLGVIRDMKARRAFGIAKYGTPLQSRNGRKALLDVYHELLYTAV